MTRVLVVEDDGKLRGELLLLLRDRGFEVETVARAEDAAKIVEGARPPDLLLLDVRLGGMSGVDLVRALAEAGNLPPTVMISGEASISETVEALRLGVHDFIEKPFSRERLLRSIQNTLENEVLRREVASLRGVLEGRDEILGESSVMGDLRERVAKAAATDARILIMGESGTGKELVAGALHRLSRRSRGPFIKINCAAIPATLMETELFGHARGAFTDAHAAKAGLFEEADGGTLFLDEIGDMDLGLQARLLRVLEDGRVRRLGETRDRQVDVRIVAATNHDLERAMEVGEFRRDLYFRLAHLPIEVPPLRERGADVRLLTRYFIDLFCRGHKTRVRDVTEDVLAALERYRWPGNVRELKNVCERLVVFGGDPITLDHLPSSVFSEAPESETGLIRIPLGRVPLPLKEFRTVCEREYIEEVLRRTGWNFTVAARLLGVARSHLHDKATAMGIRRPERPFTSPPDKAD